MDKTKPNRLKDNTNLTIYINSTYKGLEVNNKGPLIENYLNRLHTTIQKSLTDYSKTFALRFDLRIRQFFKMKALMMVP